MTASIHPIRGAKPLTVGVGQSNPMATKLPACCSGDCEDGTRDCTCGGAIVYPVVRMFDDERAMPWRHFAAYALTILWAIAASHCSATGGAL